MEQTSLTDIIQSILHNEPRVQFAESIENYLHYRSEKISFDLLQMIWNRVTNGMMIIDADGNIVAVNKAFCSLSQMTEKELKGRPFTYIYNDLVDRKRLYDEFKDQLRERNFSPFKEQYIHFRSGEVVEVEEITSVLTDDAEEVFVFCEFREIGKQKEMEQRLKESVDNLEMIREALTMLADQKNKKAVSAKRRSHPVKGLIQNLLGMFHKNIPVVSEEKPTNT